MIGGLRVLLVGVFFLACSSSSLSSRKELAIGEPNYRPWVDVIISIHQQLHLAFAERYLGSLASLPADSPLSNPALSVEVELQLWPGTGEIRQLRVVQSSGVVAFDQAVVDAFHGVRSAPFPQSLASVDGYAYLSWQLSRDQDRACSPRQARPRRYTSSP